MDENMLDDMPDVDNAANQDDILEDLPSPLGEEQGQDESSANFRQPKHGIDALRAPLPFVVQMRQTLFEVKDPIDLKEEEFERYWPYVDNVWVRQHKAGIDKAGRSNIDYYACRLQRPTYAPRKDETRPEGRPQRKKRTREGGTCQARIKITKYEGEFTRLTISRLGEHGHTHDIEHIDKIKRNSVIMDVARAEVMKGYMPASVYTVMHEDEGKLAAIGGKHVNRNDVRNASQHWRQSYKGELGVHPGYRYDIGNGILPVHIPTDTNTPGAAPPPPHPSLPPLPPDTLFFPPPTSSFLLPYLPPQTPVPPGGFPHITITYAASMDSFLALSHSTPTLISGPITKAMTHYLRSCHDAILVGVGTAISDNPTLNCRIAGAGGYGGIGWAYHPRPVVIDPSARWSLNDNSRILKAVKEGRGRGPWIIVAPGFAVNQARVELLKAHGGKYLGLPDFDARYRLSWEGIFRALVEAGIKSVMVEGGATVINELLRPENVRFVSSVVVTVAPTYLGSGGVAVGPARAIDPRGAPVPALRFRDVRWQPLGEDVVMCGRLGPTPAPPAVQGSWPQPIPPLPLGQSQIPSQVPPQVPPPMTVPNQPVSTAEQDELLFGDSVESNGAAAANGGAAQRAQESALNQLEAAAASAS